MNVHLVFFDFFDLIFAVFVEAMLCICHTAVLHLDALTPSVNMETHLWV